MRVIVVGGGVIGLSVAWRLSQQNVQVTVLDAGRAGGEASWAAAGMLAPGGELGRDTPWTRFTLRSHQMYRDFVQELKQESGIDPEWRASGALTVASTDAEWQKLEERAVIQHAVGIASERVSAAQIRQLAPALATGDWRGRWFPDDALVNPRQITQALVAACRARGVDLQENSRVRSVGNGHVLLDQREIDADFVIVAAGAWSSQIGSIAPKPLTRPVRGHLIGYTRAPETLRPILRHDHTYLLQRESGFLIAGSSEERVGFDRVVNPALAREIQHRAEALLPELVGQPYETWVGFRPGTPTGHPVLQRASERVWLAYGHYRNGILQCPATAAQLTTEILHAQADSQLTASLSPHPHGHA